METGTSQQPSDKIFTIPNVISFIRLCMIPAFLVLLFNDNNLAAAIVFGVAAATDFVDGQIARRTNSVSKLGQLLDPAVDRALMICGVLAVGIAGRCPWWIIILVLARDILLLIGGGYLLKKYRVRVPVIYLGKVATTFFFVGFAFLILNWPVLQGLGITSFTWLPGLCSGPYLFSIWFIYIGLILGTITTIYYVVKAVQKYNVAKQGLPVDWE